MKDIFYTILVVWIIWRIVNSINSHRNKQASENKQQNSRKEGETIVDFVPPEKKKMNDGEGEYVDYEEVK